jgi:hypothetical protein
MTIMAGVLAIATVQHAAKVETVCVDAEAIGYATFQSHNQKVVANRHGIFMTHLRTRNAEYTAQTWRLSRSRDGGKTFETVHEAVHATNPPVIEADAAGNLYLVRSDFVDGNAYLYRFSADRAFREPTVTPIPNGAAGKYAMAFDHSRERLYYFAHNNTFHEIALDGRVVRSMTLLKDGRNAVLQYPLLDMEGGTLHAAWTTQKRGVYLYWDIHHLCSDDGGLGWRNLGGGAVAPPVIADQTGPALRVSLDDEFEVHTWLSSLRVKEGKVHFLYLAQTQPGRQHYMRYDAKTGQRDAHRQGDLRGETIRLEGLDGFFCARSDRPGSPLYCVLQDQGRVACLMSPDNGVTWRDFARSEERFNIYSLGGCREVTDDGWIVGTFTDQGGSSLTPDRLSKVRFFRIKAR